MDSEPYNSVKVIIRCDEMECTKTKKVGWGGRWGRDFTDVTLFSKDYEYSHAHKVLIKVGEFTNKVIHHSTWPCRNV